MSIGERGKEPSEEVNEELWPESPRVSPDFVASPPVLPANEVTADGATLHHQRVDQRAQHPRVITESRARDAVDLAAALNTPVAHDADDDDTGPIPLPFSPLSVEQPAASINFDSGDLSAAGIYIPDTAPIHTQSMIVPGYPVSAEARQGSWDSRWPMDGADPASIPEAEKKVKTPKPWWRKAINIGILLVVVTVTLVILQGKLPSFQSIGQALGAAQWWWILVAGVCTAASVSLFADQQRQLLIAFDTRLTRRRATAITYASTAITNSVPAGAAVSAGFSFKQYRLAGASRSTAATVMVLSGLISAITLVLMYFVVLSFSAATSFITLLSQNTTTAIVVGALLAGLIALIIRRVIKGPEENVDDVPTPRLDRFERRWPRIANIARDGLETLRQAKNVRVRDWVWAIVATMGKWTLEGICLLACALAFGIQIDLLQLGVLYLSVQLVRQIPLTPGGIGPVETALLVGLVATGAGHGAAAAAVLIYRVLSAWIIIPVGFALLAEMKRRDARRAAVPA